MRLSSLAALAAFLSSMSAGSAPGRGEAPELAVVIDSVAEGDLGDAARAAELAGRSAALTRALKSRLEAEGLYRVAPSDPAREPLARFSGRNELHACVACLQDAAGELGATRIVAAWVYRMSNLVLTLHAQIRDAKTGALIWTRTLSFRGDNDRSWERAAAYLIRELKETPAGNR